MPEVAKRPLINPGVLLGPLLLAGLVFAACSSAPPTSGGTPTLLPDLTPVSTALPAQEAPATPSPSPTAPSATTPAAAGATPSAMPIPASDASPSLVQLEELEISNKGSVIRVFLPGLPETVAEQVRSLPAVTKVEKYLRVLRPDYPNLFFGIEPGSELRVGDTPVSLVVGEGFQSGEERVAIPGFGLNPFSGDGAMTGMAHRFSIGQSFEVDGARLRVAGLFRASDKSRENAILLPLGTAQEIFDLHGELTDIFVTVDSEDKLESVAAEIRNILVEAFR